MIVITSHLGMVVRCSLRAASRQLSEYSSTRAMNSVWKQADDSYFATLRSFESGSVMRLRSSLGMNALLWKPPDSSPAACLVRLFAPLLPLIIRLPALVAYCLRRFYCYRGGWCYYYYYYYYICRC